MPPVGTISTGTGPVLPNPVTITAQNNTIPQAQRLFLLELARAGAPLASKAETATQQTSSTASARSPVYMPTLFGAAVTSGTAAQGMTGAQTLSSKPSAQKRRQKRTSSTSKTTSHA